MKAGIHPVYELRTFHCYGCGIEWESRTTIQPGTADGKIHLDICSNCHPFFTGKQKLMDTQGRIDRFNKKYANAPKAPVKPKVAPAETKKADKAKGEKTAKPKAEKAAKAAKAEKVVKAEQAAGAEKAAAEAEQK